MSKLLGFTAVAVVAAAAVAIASLALNIVILTKVNTINGNVPPIVPTTPAPPPNSDCKAFNISQAPGFQAAAQQLLDGLDTTVDPCEDFYAFTCNNFLAKHDLEKENITRIGTYDQAQILVNQYIADYLAGINVADKTVSDTIKMTIRAVDACVMDTNNVAPVDKASLLADQIRQTFGGIPYLGEALKKDVDFFYATGHMELNTGVGTLFGSFASVDYGNIQKNALYMSQPELSLPRDFYVLPQNYDKVSARVDDVADILGTFAKHLNNTVSDDDVKTAAQQVVAFEIAIAMASWPDDLLRNYKQQYNIYNLAQLKSAYPKIKWDSYMDELFKDLQDLQKIAQDGVVLNQPSYFSWLNTVVEGNTTDPNTIANYMITQFLFENTDYLGTAYRRIAKNANYVRYVNRKGKGVTGVNKRRDRMAETDKAAPDCVDMVMSYMPYGPGYAYYLNINDTARDAAVADITEQTTNVIDSFVAMMKTLNWMSEDSLNRAINKSASIIKSFGWPQKEFLDFTDPAALDKYHKDDYSELLTVDQTDYYTVMTILRRANIRKESLRLLNEAGNRYNFLDSPAVVNAWYQPERNSIAFPFAIWNPPYYRLDFPQAYNYAGQGGTGGHELTHGFDDEGVQFGSDGTLTDCTWAKCGWMDDDSNAGFTDMAQCVVTQYSTQCCPEKQGNVHCANGATTQGENIADLGGQQAAYNAYKLWVAAHGEEARLPGMEQFTPNQVFWITYGYSWCMAQTDARLVNQLLTNPHSPGSCRTNQVMQDIPDFGKDFNCKRGQSAMFPNDDQRCKVWVGY